MPDSSTEKSVSRTAGFAQRKTAHDRGGDEAANELLLAHVRSFAPRSVSAYMPIRTEISPLWAMRELHAEGVHVGVPVILGDGLPLEFREWTPDAEMVDGPFGAAVPATGSIVIPDVVVTPMVAFDARGYRLGYGGGFYDRTFSVLHDQGVGRAVGFAYAGQQMAQVPTESTDVRLHSLVTEDQVLLFG